MSIDAMIPEQNDQSGQRPARETLWITDAELIRRIGVPEKIARVAIHGLDAQRGSGFPQKQKLWGDRRYWPAVRAYLDHTYIPASLRQPHRGA